MNQTVTRALGAILIAAAAFFIGFGCGMDAIHKDVRQDCAKMGKTRIYDDVFACSPVGKNEVRK